jgi:hypothetical protein
MWLLLNRPIQFLNRDPVLVLKVTAGSVAAVSNAVAIILTLALISTSGAWMTDGYVNGITLYWLWGLA